MPVLVVLFALLAVAALWLAGIVAANHIARRDFGPRPCWFVQEDRPLRLPRLVPGGQGILVPNPLRQINRAWLGLGLDEPGLRAPHFAVVGRDAEGAPALWGWSYRKFAFWPLHGPESALIEFASPEEIRAACPDLPPAAGDGS